MVVRGNTRVALITAEWVVGLGETDHERMRSRIVRISVFRSKFATLRFVHRSARLHRPGLCRPHLLGFLRTRVAMGREVYHGHPRSTAGLWDRPAGGWGG